MGHFYVKATFYNAVDYVEYLEEKRKLEDVRRVEAEALVILAQRFQPYLRTRLLSSRYPL